MLEDQSGSTSQESIEQPAQPDPQVVDQDIDIDSQEKVYSQKMRKRAQTAESELEKLRARNKKMEEDSLIEQNKYKELWEQDKAEAKWARDYKLSKKASLLEKIPEDKRENFKSWDLDQLETYVQDTADISESKGETMKPVPGQVSITVPDKPYGEMTDAERRAYYTQAAQEKGLNP